MAGTKRNLVFTAVVGIITAVLGGIAVQAVLSVVRSYRENATKVIGLDSSVTAAFGEMQTIDQRSQATHTRSIETAAKIDVLLRLLDKGYLHVPNIDGPGSKSPELGGAQVPDGTSGHAGSPPDAPPADPVRTPSPKPAPPERRTEAPTIILPVPPMQQQAPIDPDLYRQQIEIKRGSKK